MKKKDGRKKAEACPQCGKSLGKCPICKGKLFVEDAGSLMDDTKICYVKLACENPECVFNVVYHLSIRQIQTHGILIEED